MKAIPRYNVLGVGVSVLTLDTAANSIINAVKDNIKGYVCVTGVHGVSEAQKDKNFRKILNQSYLNTPDGMPLVWLGKSEYGEDLDRVYGPDLMLEICKRTASKEISHFLYGGDVGVAENLAKNLSIKFPGIKIAGFYSPPFRSLNEGEITDLVKKINNIAPDIIWVGLSTPKQEKFMSDMIDLLDTKIMIGVGAAFDFHTGRVRQAPRFIQRSGFEWLFRMIQEPRRLFVRYLKNNPLFIIRVLLQKSGIKKYEI